MTVGSSFHFLDQSFTETIDEPEILAETKDRPKSEVVFFVWTQRFAERFAMRLNFERSLNTKLIS